MLGSSLSNLLLLARQWDRHPVFTLPSFPARAIGSFQQPAWMQDCQNQDHEKYRRRVENVEIGLIRRDRPVRALQELDNADRVPEDDQRADAIQRPEVLLSTSSRVRRLLRPLSLPAPQTFLYSHSHEDEEQEG